MARVTAFTVSGLALWFNSNDHQPPHFHAERNDEWEVRVAFLKDAGEMFTVVYRNKANRPSKSDLRELAALAVTHRAALLDEWHAKVKVG